VSSANIEVNYLGRGLDHRFYFFFVFEPALLVSFKFAVLVLSLLSEFLLFLSKHVMLTKQRILLTLKQILEPNHKLLQQLRRRGALPRLEKLKQPLLLIDQRHSKIR